MKITSVALALAIIHRYIESLEADGYLDDMDFLVEMEEDDCTTLMDDCGMKKAHRMKFKKALQKLRDAR